MVIDDQGIFFPDISFYQGDPLRGKYVDFEKMRSYGVEVAVIRAGQALYADSAFRYNWEYSARAGISRSSYYYLDPAFKGSHQARFYWGLLKQDPGKMMFLDIEGGAIDWNQWYQFLEEFRNISGMPNDRIGIYIGHYHWKDFRPIDRAKQEYFHQFVLWYPWYASDAKYVLKPLMWSEAEILMWQKGTPPLGRQMGTHSLDIDYNVFNGGRDRLRARLFEERNLHDISVSIRRV